MNDLCLSAIIAIEDLQKLQDAFARANRVASTIVDPAGKNITSPSNHSKVCDLVRKTSKGLKKCIISGKKMGLNAVEGGEPYYSRCESIGFVDAAAPIFVDGVHVANWLIGQNCVGEVDDRRIVSYAEEIGADKQEMLDAFHGMEKIPESEFVKKLEFLSIMANQLSLLAFQNKITMEMVEELSVTKKKLEEYQEHLEVLVKERTDEIVQLRGFLPICMHCKQIRDDKGYWNKLEAFIEEHSEAQFSHSLCDACLERYYPEEAGE